MDQRPVRAAAAAAVLIATLAFAPAALAEGDEVKLGWTDTAEFSLVGTQGNSESLSVGLKNETSRTWERSRFDLRFGGIRVDSTTGERIAIQDAQGGIRTVDPDTEVTAESYYLNSRYGHDITDRFFWFVGAGWERNEFAGYDNRYVGEAGVGNTWYDREDLQFRTGYSVTYTKQENIVELPTDDDTWAGYRFTWRYLHKWHGNMTYTNDLTLDGNLDESSAWRGDMDNGFAVAMTERLALKVGLRFLYENRPALEDVTLFDENLAPLGTIPIELDELDTYYTVSLVLNWD